MQGLEVFKEEHGRYPDLVVLHSNYWDVAQIVLFRGDDGKEHAYGPLMKAWLANAEKVGKFLQVHESPHWHTSCHRALQRRSAGDPRPMGKSHADSSTWAWVFPCQYLTSKVGIHPVTHRCREGLRAPLDPWERATQIAVHGHGHSLANS